MIKIRNILPVEVNEAASLISKTFRKFNYNDGRVEAVQDYIDFYDPTINEERIQKGFRRTPICFIAVNESHIIGMIRGYEYRLINLFVDEHHHRKRIGTDLLKRYEKKCLGKGSKEVKVRASLYAVPFYKANGYKKTTGLRNLAGLTIQPMIKKIG